MKNIVLLFICYFLFNSCDKYDGGCEGAYESFIKEPGKYYGIILSNDSNAYWLNYNNNGTQVFYENDNGFQLAYLEKGGFHNDEHVLRTYGTGEKRRCVGEVLNEDYYRAEFEYLDYEPMADGNYYSINRYQSLKWDSIPTDSFKLTNKLEYLYFTDSKFDGDWNSRRFVINKDTLYNGAVQKFYLTKKLRHTIYNNVFELINIDLDNSLIQTKGYYFSYEKGLIGYYLTNNELWLKR
ncbi:MAG: hypothetical protein V4620_10950 [Bacteroidota bacterium]